MGVALVAPIPAILTNRFKMTVGQPDMRILTGVEMLVDCWLNVELKGQPPFYRHKSAALRMSNQSAPICGTQAFLASAYDQIDQNWKMAIDAGYSKPSRENWRWKRHLNLSPANQSPELNLERAIVRAGDEVWSNQMPTASGLVGSTTNKRAAVDLVQSVIE